ncbi:MAG: 2-oxo acid dehydrogenase subunit E2, partial [Alkalispirochaetaceae bacterium]
LRDARCAEARQIATRVFDWDRWAERVSGVVRDLAGRAREKKIKPEEMEGGTFTISNLGGIGGTGFTPVVFPPQVAILGVARSQTKPVWRDGEFEPRLILPLSLSYDHRVIDGADGSRFLRWICDSLEQPLYMELEGDEV